MKRMSIINRSIVQLHYSSKGVPIWMCKFVACKMPNWVIAALLKSIEESEAQDDSKEKTSSKEEET